MRAVIDSSTWISLARAGILELVPAVPIEPVLLDLVHAEIVGEGRSGGHPDAAALEAAVSALPVTSTKPAVASTDAAVLAAAQDTGVLVANDLALGRRARSLGVTWIRTGDLIVLAVLAGSMSRTRGTEAVEALEQCGRITRELAEAYRERLR